MSAFVKYDDFIIQLGLGSHNLDTDTLKIALLTGSYTPSASDTVFTGISANEVVSNSNGYVAGGNDIANTYIAEPAGTGKLTGTTLVWTAVTNPILLVRYAVLYNDTSASKNLIAYWDYGSEIAEVLPGETFTVTIGASGVLTLT